MSTISLRAISHNKKLTGAEISYREAIASYCATYQPYTDKQVKVIGERVGMDPAQSSTSMSGLIKKGQVARENGRTYLLALDDFQLEKIAETDFGLLEILAHLGSIEAKNVIVKITKKIADSTIENRFLLHFFMFAQLSFSHLNLSDSQSPIYDSTILNVKTTIALKEYNVLKNVLRNVLQNEDKEESFLSSFFILDEGINLPAADDNTDSVSCKPDAEPRQTEVPPGEGSGLNDSHKTEVPQRGEGSNSDKTPVKPRKAEVPQLSGEGSGDRSHKRKLRKDLSNDEWLAWIKKHADYAGVDVQGKYDEMIAWCAKKSQTPSRRRLLNWLEDERASLPINLVSMEEKTNGTSKTGGSQTAETNDAHLRPRGISV